MDDAPQTLIDAWRLARDNATRFPNESADYRAARTALLAEEIELRRHIERVNRMRRALPPGGEVSGDYRFEAEDGSTTDVAGLFGDKDTLAAYSFMFGPAAKRPCPMCTALLGPLDGNAADLDQKLSLVVIARAPMERLIAYKKERGWRHLRLYRDLNDIYSKAYHGLSADGDDIPGFNVFTKKDGVVRHFWSGEMGGPTADPGQDPRGAPDLSPLWHVLDMTPQGRGADWYPKLDY